MSWRPAIKLCFLLRSETQQKPGTAFFLFSRSGNYWLFSWTEAKIHQLSKPSVKRFHFPLMINSSWPWKGQIIFPKLSKTIEAPCNRPWWRNHCPQWCLQPGCRQHRSPWCQHNRCTRCRSRGCRRFHFHWSPSAVAMIKESDDDHRHVISTNISILCCVLQFPLWSASGSSWDEALKKCLYKFLKNNKIK